MRCFSLIMVFIPKRAKVKRFLSRLGVLPGRSDCEVSCSGGDCPLVAVPAAPSLPSRAIIRVLTVRL